MILNEQTKIQETGMVPLQETGNQMEKSPGKNQQNPPVRRPKTGHAHGRIPNPSRNPGTSSFRIPGRTGVQPKGTGRTGPGERGCSHQFYSRGPEKGINTQQGQRAGIENPELEPVVNRHPGRGPLFTKTGQLSKNQEMKKKADARDHNIR